MTNTYTDCIAYSKQPTGLVLGGYIGNMARISAASIGDMALTVPALTVALNEYDPVYVFDGPSSEKLRVGAAGALVGATSIPLLDPVAFAHSAGTPYCTDGSVGSLGEQIFTASKWIEDDICNQALWTTTYTNEVLTMPTMRAAIDNQQNIHFRPRHFPITALASVAVKVKTFTTPYDQTQATIDSDQQTVDLPLTANQASNQQGQGSPWNCWSIGRTTTGWVYITYTAGFAVGAMPRPVSRACSLLINECFVQLDNPDGADSITQNKRAQIFAIRGDTTGESLLVKQATRLLQPYIAESF